MVLNNGQNIFCISSWCQCEVKLTFDLLDIQCHYSSSQTWICMYVSVIFIIVCPTYHMNCRVLRKCFVRSQRPWLLTNQITSCLSPNEQLSQTLTNPLEVFLRHCVDKNETTWDDSDLWLLKSNQFILESLSTFVQHLKTFSEGTRADAFTRMGRTDIRMDTWTDRQTTSKHNASGHSCRQRGNEKKNKGPS